MATATPSQRLRELGVELPPVTKPVGAYVPALRHGDVLYLSGQVPLVDGKVRFTGRVGAERTLEEAVQAARVCALNAVGIAADAAGGIDRIARVLKVVVYVASTPEFTEQHKAANGASDLLADLFGEAGRHARAAVGMASLPLNATVEVDVTFALKSA
jgi:enamine deaminase RidA (YjgF/YER057c/UK114 family)